MRDNGKQNVGNLIRATSSRSTPKRGEIYKHFKGKYYIVEDIAYDTERNAESVVYRAAYGECKLFVRDLKMFMEILPSGVARFTRVDSIPEPKAPDNKTSHACPKCGHKNEFNPDEYKNIIQSLSSMMFPGSVQFAANIRCENCGEHFQVKVDSMLR